jgi:glyoxylase-like metal-dependent hydrolase (beta-lactamase superfamily II)
MAACNLDWLRAGSLEIGRVETGARWKQNCYVVRDISSGEQAVIDPGADVERIIAALDPLRPLRHILLTHAHYDHLGAAAELCARYGIAARVHARDRRLVHLAPTYARSFEQLRVQAPRDVEVFDDGASFAVGASVVEVILTPGHTPGSVCFRAGDAVFTGDTLFHAKVGRTDLPGGDADALRRSVSALLEASPPGLHVLPGHGRAWTTTQAREWWSTHVAERAMSASTAHA